MSSHRNLQYSLAINEALHQMMEKDASVFLIGQGVKSPYYSPPRKVLWFPADECGNYG